MGQVTERGLQAMVFQVSYEAVYEYEDVVLLNDNVVKIVPYPGGNQKLIWEEVRSEPEGYKVRFMDSFGNVNYRIKVTEPHKSLRLESQALVEVTKVPMIDCQLPCNLNDTKFLDSSDLVDVDFFREMGKEILNSSKTLDQLIRNVVSTVRGRIKYQPGVTYVNTSATQSFQLGKGVCQDFAHVTIGVLRAIGVPARYVMGVVDDRPKVTHAWVEVMTPTGWVAVDPTRGRLYDISYIKFAIGRDYNDTPPVNGSFISTGKGRLSTVKVGVVAK